MMTRTGLYRPRAPLSEDSGDEHEEARPLVGPHTGQAVSP